MRFGFQRLISLINLALSCFLSFFSSCFFPVILLILSCLKKIKREREEEWEHGSTCFKWRVTNLKKTEINSEGTAKRRTNNNKRSYGKQILTYATCSPMGGGSRCIRQGRSFKTTWSHGLRRTIASLPLVVPSSILPRKSISPSHTSIGNGHNT